MDKTLFGWWGVGRSAFFAAVMLAAALQTGDAARASSLTVSGISIGWTKAALILPPKPRGAMILLAGGDGDIGVGADGSIAREGNQLVRTRDAYAARGFAVLVPDSGVDVAQAVETMRKYGSVTLVGTSRGTQRAARGIAAGARPNRLVLTSGFLSNASGDTDNVMAILGSASQLPPTLVVHHRHDGCSKTRPEGVDPFLAWAGKRARVVWLDGGSDNGDPCQARSHHGFSGIDGAVVSAVSGFAR